MNQDIKCTIRELAAAQPGHTHIAVGPYCWGSDADATKALANAKAMMPRSYLPSGFRPAFHVVLATIGCYVNDMGGFSVPKGGSIKWLGAYSATGIRRDDIDNPYD